MRRPPRPSRMHDAGGHVNVTPMIDVVMCLIVFFLLVGHLARQEAGRVDLPGAAGGSDDRDLNPVVIGLPEPGVVTLEGRPVDPRALGDQLARTLAERGQARRAVELRAARDLDYAHVRAVLDELRDAGVPRLTLVAEHR